jgi:hypothetical protein
MNGRNTRRSRKQKGKDAPKQQPSQQPSQQKAIKTAIKDAVEKQARQYFSRQHFQDFGGGVGSRVGAIYGVPEVGRKLGRAAGGLLSQVTGFGQYNITSNSLINRNGQPPTTNALTFQSTNEGVRIRGREFLGEIRGDNTGAFRIQGYRINPGDPSTFPRLYTLAACFDQYRMHGMIFRYTSNSGEFNGDNQSLGAVIMATEYDVSDPIPGDRSRMQNMEYSCSDKPSNGLEHGIECDPHQTTAGGLFTNGVPPDVEDSNEFKLYDLGTFYIATTGINTAAGEPLLGTLEVEFDVEFIKMQMPDIGNTVITAWTPLLTGSPPTEGINSSTEVAANVLSGWDIMTTTGYNVLYTTIASGTYIITTVVGGTGMSAANCILDFYDYNEVLRNDATVNYQSSNMTSTTTSTRTGIYKFDIPIAYVRCAIATGTGATTFKIMISPFSEAGDQLL